MIESCFLSIDEDQPLGIWWADSYGCGVIELDKFLNESMIDMSKEQADRYAKRLRQFVDDLTSFVPNLRQT